MRKADLEISVDDAALVHVFEAEDDFCGVEAHLVFAEHAVLRQVVVQVAAVHEVEDEAELLRRLKCIRHADDKWGSILRRSTQHHVTSCNGSATSRLRVTVTHPGTD